MTLTEIEASSEEFLTPADVKEILGCDQYAINLQAREDPAKLGFPVNIMGTRVRIPRRAFLHWLKYGNAPLVMQGGSGWDAARERYVERGGRRDDVRDTGGAGAGREGMHAARLVEERAGDDGAA